MSDAVDWSNISQLSIIQYIIHYILDIHGNIMNLTLYLFTISGCHCCVLCLLHEVDNVFCVQWGEHLSRQ